MTGIEMGDLLFKYVGRRTDATPELRTLYLNEAQRDIAIDFFFDELETASTTLFTVAGVPTYSPPSEDYIIENMRIISPDKEAPLEEMDWDWYNENHSFEDDVTRQPDVWVMRGGLIWFDPTPDDAYQLFISGRRLPSPISITQVDSSILPTDWHLILVMQAATDMLFLFGNDARAMNLKNETLGKISARQEKRTTRRVRGSGQMKVEFVAPLRRTRGRRRLNLRDED